MRQTVFTGRAAAALPAALAGSIAITMVGSPAHAAEPAASRDAQVSETRTAGARPATYTVVRGDTVTSIARRFGLRTTDVLAWNGLGWSSVIRPGQVLRLAAATAARPATATAPAPAPAPAAVSYTVRAGDTVSAIAHRHGVGVPAVLAANRLTWTSVIYPGQKLVIPGKATAAPPAQTMQPVASTQKTTTYVVRAGDTVSGIAARHGVSPAAMLAANRLGWGSIIYPGQHLTVPTTASPAVAGLSAEQAANARLIIRVGRSLGVPDRGIAIALGTAMQESGLRNLDHGDRDSLGLFQQRPSTGWGSRAQVRDAERSARAFYGGPSDPNGAHTRGLLDVSGWAKMTFAQAAQAVQISAYPNAYAKWEKPAYAWLAALG